MVGLPLVGLGKSYGLRAQLHKIWRLGDGERRAPYAMGKSSNLTAQKGLQLLRPVGNAFAGAGVFLVHLGHKVADLLRLSALLAQKHVYGNAVLAFGGCSGVGVAWVSVASEPLAA
jgi:hypothetical protein